MLDPEVKNTRMMAVVDFEVDYAIKALKVEYEEKLGEKVEEKLKEEDEEFSKSLAEKSSENKRLKAILDEHNILY